ncbi:MAG: DMT family transporter [Agriterribacter sp.]
MYNNPRNQYVGAVLALLAVIIWSGNFIVARAVIKSISPFSLSFYRWGTAAVIMLPIALNKVKQEWTIIKKSLYYLFWVSLSGITLFNMFVYIGGHYTTAINLALIGTTSSPIIAVVLARIFLKEEISWQKIVGMFICLLGVIFLISKGDINNLLHFQFGIGDRWVLLGATCFAIYNILVRKKPDGLSAISFLFMVFALGTVLLIPFYVWDILHGEAIQWSVNLVWVIVYLGLGASAIAYLCWNIAIRRLGASPTALFGNLLPVFSTIEAAFILNEQFTWVHLVSMLLVFTGILLANYALFRPAKV